MADFDLSKLEPAAEEVTLPSKGVFYNKDKNRILFDSKGKILIRPMTLKEEIAIKTPRIIKSGQILNVLLRECIKTPGIDSLHLLSSDRMFLFFYLRTISYGDEYPFVAKCPSCGSIDEHIVKLSSLEIKYSNPNETEPFEVPLKGYKTLIRMTRGFDEEAFVNNESDIITNSDRIKESFKEEETDFTVKNLVATTIDIPGVPREYWAKFYETLSPKETAILNEKTIDVEPGLKNDVSIKCKNAGCGKIFNDRVPVNANFFRVSREGKV